MAKIVYTSGSGSTKRYAEMLGEKTGYSVVDLKKAKATDEEIIYCGWVMMGDLQGYKEAKQLGKIKLVVAVGMMGGDEAVEKLKKKNEIEEPMFFLMGALDKKTFMSKLEDMFESKMKEELNNPMMSMMIKPMVGMAIKKLLAQFKDGDEDSKKVFELIEEGFDLVSEENLQPVLDCLSFSAE